MRRAAGVTLQWLVTKRCKECFPAGTEVRMGDGSTRKIEEVKPGDTVLSSDPVAGKTAPMKVTQLIVTHDDKTFNKLSLRTPNGLEELTATSEHPFWHPSTHSWQKAKNLRPGDTLLTESGKTVRVERNTGFGQNARTYNLTVDGFHTYFVLAGDTAILVHNCTGGSASGLNEKVFDELDDAYGPQVADGVDYNVQVMHGTDAPRASSHTIPGIGHDPGALGDYFNSFRNANYTHVDTVIEPGSSQAEALWDPSHGGVVILRTTRMIHGYSMSEAAFLARFEKKKN
jgi:hypothetical protein